MKIYFISGLGTDRNVFSNLNISKNHKIVHLGWIPPNPEESLRSYALRLVEKINSQEPFSIVGLSLGGIVATEIAKSLKPKKVILISSIYSSDQFPAYFRTLIKTGMLKILPIKNIQKRKGLYNWFFGAKTKEDKEMLQNCIKNSNPAFTRWALSAIANWKNRERPPNLIQVHGGKDRILKYSRVKPDYTIEDGGHLTIFHDHEMISDIINSEVED